jgi:DNA-binding CsgD family transcriptional regulator
MASASGLLQRERELAVLTEAFARGRDGAGTLTVISGAAGTGKSVLLAAAAGFASGLCVRLSRASELEQDLPFGVVRQLLQPVLHSVSEDARARLLSGAASPMRRLLADTTITGSPADPGGFSTLDGFYWLIAGLGAERPLLLAVDDVQWADADSLRALAYLAVRLSDLPVALVITLRTDEHVPVSALVAAVESQPHPYRIDLRGLDAAGVGELVRTVIPTANEELCAAFHQSTAGNPFYLRELLRSITPGERSTLTASDVRAASVTSVADRVIRRLAAIGPAAPPLAAAMSVLGMTGRLSEAAAVAGQDEAIAAAAAQAMKRVGVLASPDPFEWIHPLVYRSVYDSLTPTERDGLHAAAVATLEGFGAPAGVLAVHLSALRPAGSTRVVAGVLRAADEALERDAPEAAARLVRRALKESAAEPARGGLLLKLGQIEMTRRDPGAIGILRDALESLTDPRDRVFASLSLGESLVHVGEWDGAAAVVGGALSGIGDDHPDLRLELEVAYALVCAFDPALVERFWCDRLRLRELSRGDSWPCHALSAMLAMTTAQAGEDLDDVIPLCEQALAGGVLLAERGAGAWASAHVLMALAGVEEYDRALAVADQVALAAHAQGSVANSLVVDVNSAWITVRRGDLARAEELMRPIQELTIANGMLLVLVTALWFSRDLMAERPAQADMAALVESLEVPRAFADAAGGAWLMATRAATRLQRGDRAGAEHDLRKAGSIYERLHLGPLHDPWRSALALVIAQEAPEEATSLVSEELALVDNVGFARPRAVALRAAGLLAGGDAGIELLGESARLLEGSPGRYEYGKSLVALGAALRRRGLRADSREPLRAGMEVAYRCGADRLLATAREELLAGGARPRRIVRSGFEALTASERRVARFAASGRSNTEIAQTLHISLKTVETHLSSVYGKLGVSGQGARGRLATVVAAAEPHGETAAHAPRN